jgi:hypothetical protein
MFNAVRKLNIIYIHNKKPTIHIINTFIPSFISENIVLPTNDKFFLDLVSKFSLSNDINYIQLSNIKNSLLKFKQIKNNTVIFIKNDSVKSNSVKLYCKLYYWFKYNNYNI